MPEDGFRRLLDDTKRLMKIDREVGFNEVADLSILREAQGSWESNDPLIGGDSEQGAESRIVFSLLLTVLLPAVLLVEAQQAKSIVGVILR